MLEIKDLHVNYGAVHALNGVSMTVKDGEIGEDEGKSGEEELDKVTNDFVKKVDEVVALKEKELMEV